MVPILRTFISLPAGVARMPLGRFTVFTFLGCLPWCIFLVLVGNVAGNNWDTWEHRLGYLNYLVVAAVVGLGCVWVVRRRRAARV
jgi:membrane protein DedA with SNARE-associated domain